MSMERTIYMRNFSWNYFWTTGDLGAYMLYKEVSKDDRNNFNNQDDDGFDPEFDEVDN